MKNGARAARPKADNDSLVFNCPVEATLSVIGGKYKAIILHHLSCDGVLRFGELSRRVPQATPKMLAQQLRGLEADGIITRVAYPVVPPRTEYSLTEFGATLAPVIKCACDWGLTYIDETGARLTED